MGELGEKISPSFFRSIFTANNNNYKLLTILTFSNILISSEHVQIVIFKATEKEISLVI